MASDGIVPLTQAQFVEQEKAVAKEGALVRDLVAVDECANTLMGGLPDETISSRLARDAEKHEVIGEIGSKILDEFEADHGAKAQAGDVERAEAVIAAEKASGGI